MVCGYAIAFNGLLRTGELLQLLVSDCNFTEQCGLTLQRTKGGQRRLLQDESVVITDPRCWQNSQKEKILGHSLIPFSPAKFRTLSGLPGILNPRDPSAKRCFVGGGSKLSLTLPSLSLPPIASSTMLIFFGPSCRAGPARARGRIDS